MNESEIGFVVGILFLCLYCEGVRSACEGPLEEFFLRLLLYPLGAIFALLIPMIPYSLALDAAGSNAVTLLWGQRHIVFPLVAVPILAWALLHRSVPGVFRRFVLYLVIMTYWHTGYYMENFASKNTTYYEQEILSQKK